MRIDRLWLTDFRSYTTTEASFAPGLTAVLGRNGQGKTNLLEAVAYLATLASFRGAPVDAMVRTGADRAVIRAAGERQGRALLVEAEIAPGSRSRVQVNRQPLRRSRDLLGALRVSVFSPDDLVLVKGGPSERRGYLDDVLVALHPRNDGLRSDVDRVLRQRNALLKQAGGRLTTDIEQTLDVWDAKFVVAGEALAAARAALVERMAPVLSTAYRQVAGVASDLRVTYDPRWWHGRGLAGALEEARRDELRRGVSLVGPHRDDLHIDLGGMPARTHASQGEQRSVALALRLATHRIVTEVTETPPILLLDDVFSELDPQRSDALMFHLPGGQTVLTAAGALPAGALPDTVLRVDGGSITG